MTAYFTTDWVANAVVNDWSRQYPGCTVTVEWVATKGKWEVKVQDVLKIKV